MLPSTLKKRSRLYNMNVFIVLIKVTTVIFDSVVMLLQELGRRIFGLSH
jgi:hypothetical protein